MPEKLDYLEAALEVLRRARRPLTTAELTDEAIQLGLLAPAGKTPRSTMPARLYTEVRDNPTSPVVRLFVPGNQRARRQSVRWSLRDA